MCSFIKNIQIYLKTIIVYGSENIDSSYEELKLYYYKIGLANNIDEITSRISKDDLQKILEDENTNRLYKKDSDGKFVKYYDNIILNNSYELYLDYVYEILLEENCDVDGNKDAFIVYADDGKEYEFSKEFKKSEKETWFENKWIKEEDNKNTYDTYYYKVNGEEKLLSKFVPYIHYQSLNQWFGLSLGSTSADKLSKTE